MTGIGPVTATRPGRKALSGSEGMAPKRRHWVPLLAGLALVGGLLRVHPALAGTCDPSACLGLGVGDVAEATQPASVDSVAGSATVSGSRSWFFQIKNSSTQSATHASISVQTGYPVSSFRGVNSVPVSTTMPSLDPGQQLELDLNALSSTIPVSFSPGFDSSRSMDLGDIPRGGATQSVQIAFTRTDSSACITNTPGMEGCNFGGDLDTGLAGAAIVGLDRPSNLSQSEGFSSTMRSDHATWGLNDPVLGKQYVVTVRIALPDRGVAYHYKPFVGLALSATGPHGCQQDSCVGPTTHVTLPDSTLDGPTPGSGQLAFSVDQPFMWDQGGPPKDRSVRYSGLAEGYWLVAADGGIFPFGAAGGLGSTGGMTLNQPIVGMAATLHGGGYWLVAADGGIFPFGDAAGLGSTGNITLNKPIVGMAAMPDNGGYWLVAADGGIFPFGDARGYGSTGAVKLNKPIVAMAATADGGGYWLVASDGGIFPFGDAVGFGSTGSMQLNKPIVGVTATGDGGGYWLAASDGGIFPFGDATGFGSTGAIQLNKPIVGMVATPDTKGYWLVASDGGIFPFGDATGFGSLGSVKLNKPILGIAAP